VNQYAIPDEGLPGAVDTLVRAGLILDQPLELRLFVNDLVPLRGTTLADYVEATFTGYTRRTLERGDWNVAELGADHVARITRAGGPESYMPESGGQTVYGCYLVDIDAGVVRWQGRFATPKEVAAGEGFKVNPVITGRAVVSVV
jgi:hypothetical protein